ncbi:MAG: hypothetical protein A2231_03095 [Candidatus Firestonebacteria bacterium RIFOXYA2_FULL_40_8]|nr:MAG: hypothetical protein A2231_03095 [Candidatus Firestonebacteria bacterium RIFOXYA2_FULL_40_8]
MKLKAPFPYFGGKSRIAHTIWKKLGNVKHYIEPFFGSGAVLLARPNYIPGTHTETVNDKDGFVCNVWRSLIFMPDETARWCDWPVNHADLMARRQALLKNEEYLLENLIKDEKWCDPVLAGYWIWAASCWIGSGLTRPNAIPKISSKGLGVHSLAYMSCKRPHIAHGGKNIHAKCQIPHILDGGKGINTHVNIYDYLKKLQTRLRYVRVVCGDWSRVCGGDWQDGIGICGIFFDPPYSDKAGRDNSIYHVESTDVAHDVRKWAIPRGDKETYRIVIAGYEGEHNELEKYGWGKIGWTATRGYSSSDNDNRKKERLWCSPHCIKDTFL